MRMFRYTLILSIASCALGANPTQTPTIDSGSVSTTVTGLGTSSVAVSVASEITVLDWDNFSIDTSEQVMFSRADSNNAYYVMNKITGGSQSTINGSLLTAEDNGNIFLYNSSGLVIGSSGVIITGSFVGTTLDPPSTFLPTTNQTYTGSSTKTLTNAGSIRTTSGDAILIGYRVVNSGTITATSIAGIGSGVSITLKPTDAQRIFIETSGSSGTGTGIEITSAGTVNGESVVLVADGNPYSLAVNMSGTVSATTCSSSDGQILLLADPKTNEKGEVEIAGTIKRNATTGCGPNVNIHGNIIALKSGSKIDVSGDTGGGNVTIGDLTTYPTDSIYIASTAQVLTNGTSTGSGGNVTMYAGTSLLDLGVIESKGAGSAGNGGAVSLTSPGYLGYNGTVDTTVSGSGTIGRLTATSSAVNIGGSANYSSNFAPTAYTTSSVTSILTKTNLEATLATSHVTVNAIGTSATGDLKVVGDITWSSGRNLTLIAAAMIQVDYDVTMTGTVASSLSVVDLTAPIILIGTAAQTHTSSAGFDLTTGSMTAVASNHMSLYGGGATNTYARFSTASGTNTTTFGNYLRLVGGDSSGASAEMKGTTVVIDAITAGTGTLLVQADDCSSAFINGATVNIGTTTKPEKLTIIGGKCSANNEAYVGSTTSGSDVTAHVTKDVSLSGGITGSSNKASIISNGGTSKAIVITAEDIYLTGGTGGTNNTARIASLGTTGTVTLTATQDVKLTAGTSSATATSAQIQGDVVAFTTSRDVLLTGGANTLNRAFINGSSGITGTVGRHLHMQSGSAATTSTEIRSTNGNISLTSDSDIRVLGGGGGPDTHSRIYAAVGHIVVVAGQDIILTTGTHSSSDAYIHSGNGNVTVTSTRDTLLTGSCSMPNTAYVQGTGTVAVTASRDIVQRGKTHMTSTGSNLTATASGNHLVYGCTSGLSGLKDHQSEYYKYFFLYELFYRMRTLTYQDWHLNLSNDFWQRMNYVDP